MNQLFRVTNEEIFIDNLILETSGCVRNCKDCYLKAHKQKGKDLEPDIWFKLIWSFLMSARHKVNQISVSINDRTDNEWNAIDEILALISTLRENGEGIDTRLHLTLFNPSTISQYKNLTLKYFTSVDSIYFSNINEEEVDLIKELRALNKNIKVGWNSLPPSTITGRVFRQLDGIYYLINKSQDDGYRLSEEVYCAGAGPKIQNDICWRDYTNWKKDWHNTTCSANISKFTVWPDGSVSGCPYAEQSNTGPATTYKDILKNIVKASEYYDFNKCPMKEIYG